MTLSAGKNPVQPDSRVTNAVHSATWVSHDPIERDRMWSSQAGVGSSAGASRANSISAVSV
jgi:hypothetical protein